MAAEKHRDPVRRAGTGAGGPEPAGASVGLTATPGTRAAAKPRAKAAAKPRAKAAAKPKAKAKAAAEPGTASGEGSAAPKAAGTVTADGVNLGHLFALRPRVSTSFRQEDFRAAKLRLAEETYPNIREAARAVAREALERAQEGPPKHGFRRRTR